MCRKDRSVPCNIIDFAAARHVAAASRSEVDLINLVEAAFGGDGLPRQFDANAILPKGIALVFNNPDDATEPLTRFRATAPLRLRPVFDAIAASTRDQPADPVANVLCALSVWLQEDSIAAVV
jgi:hypothetical protein